MAERTSKVFTALIYAFVGLLLAGVLASWIDVRWSGSIAVWTAAAVAAAVGAAVLLGRIKLEIRLKDGWIALILAGICFAVKLVAVLRWRVAPASDYATFATTAADLARDGSISYHRYVALFPHIYGYSAFLSVFYRIFGDGILVAPIVNAGLSALTAALIYLLVRRYSCRKSSVFAAFLWIICPSQTLFNIYVLSEPLYTAELAGAMLLCDSLRRRLKSDALPLAGTAGLAAGLGLLLAAIQLVRPIGVIIVIALAGTLLCIDLPYGLKLAGKRAGALAVVVAVMLCGTKLVGLRMDAALGEPAAKSVGYSVAVGLCEKSGGRWDADVSARLMAYSGEAGATADYAQRRMMDDVRSLIKSNEIDYPSLFKTKFENLLSHDNAAVMHYGKSVFARQELFADVCDVFWLAASLLAAVGCVCALVRKERGVLLIAALYGFGLVAAQMLVEVAIRYHYSLYLAIIPLAIYGLSTISGMIWKSLDERVQKGIKKQGA